MDYRKIKDKAISYLEFVVELVNGLITEKTPVADPNRFIDMKTNKMQNWSEHAN